MDYRDGNKSDIELRANDNNSRKYSSAVESDDDFDRLVSAAKESEFSTAQERFLKDNDLKHKALESLYGSKGEKDKLKRRLSFLDYPHHHLPNRFFHPSALNQENQATLSSHLPQDEPSEELIDICEDIHTSLELRHKYLGLSLQLNEGDNPKNKRQSHFINREISSIQSLRTGRKVIFSIKVRCLYQKQTIDITLNN